MQPILLAPAGSFDSLQAAIDAGCNAVFFGISDFNMRATASKNFTVEDLPQIVSICKENNVETNLTVNTVLYDEDLPRMKKIVDAASKAGVDSIISSDFATIQYVQSKKLDVHISTQLSVSNIEAVKYYSKFATRIVLARELTLEQVAKICSEIKKQKITGPTGKLVEIEAFAHGAMCVALSGRCSMSLYCHGTSANRGSCTQPCRRPYKVTDLMSGKELVVDNNYVMSASDLCTIAFIPQLIEAGISVFKLEGRGRSPEYVDTVVSSYRQAIDAHYDGTFTKEKVDKWNEDLGTVYNRGKSTGSYMGRHLDEWSQVPNNQATEQKVRLGLVSNYFAKANVVELTITEGQQLRVGDKVSVTGPKTGIARADIKKLLVHNEDKTHKKVKVANKGDWVTFKIDKKVKRGDVVSVLREANK